MPDPKVYKSDGTNWVPRNLTATLSLVDDTALQAEVVSRNLPRIVEVATYQGIDPTAYPVDTLISVTGIGLVFRVINDATAGNILVPEQWYQRVGGSITTGLRLHGDVDPSAETPAWTDSVGGTGTITSDGTYITVSTPIATDTVQVYFDFGATSGPLMIHGLVDWNTLTSPANADAAHFRLIDGVDHLFAAVKNGRYEFMDSGGDISANADSYFLPTAPVSLNVEHHFMMTVDDDVIEIYQNGILVASAQKSLGSADTSRVVAFGDASSSGALILYVREIYAAAA